METVLELAPLEKNTMEVERRANAIQIRTPDEYGLAGDELKIIKALEKQVMDTFADPIKKAHAAHKSLVAAKDKHLEPLEAAERIIKGKMSTYAAEQERIRQERERELQEQMRRQEEERQLAEAVAAEQAGNAEEATAIMEQPVIAPPVVLASTTPKLSGVATVENWKFRITDETQIPREYLLVDQVKIGKVVRAMKSNTNIPGVQAYPEAGVRVRS